MPIYRHRITQVEDITLPQDRPNKRRFFLRVEVAEDPQGTTWELKLVLTCSCTRLSVWSVLSPQMERNLFYICGKKALEAGLAFGEIQEVKHNEIHLDLDAEYGQEPPCDPNGVHFQPDEWSEPVEVKRRIGF